MADSQSPWRPRRGPTTLGQSVDRVTGPALRRRGFAERSIVTGWGDIVGRPLADHTRPIRVVFPRGMRAGGALHLTVTGAFAPEVEHLAPQIVERINTCFGYGAIARIEIHHGPVTPPANTADSPPAEAVAQVPEGPLATAIAAVEDDSLKAALDRLARARAAAPRKTGGTRKP
jgi:hypothetical protein